MKNKNNKIIYLDNYLNTPIEKEVLEVIYNCFQNPIMPSNYIKEGTLKYEKIKEIKKIIAKSFHYEKVNFEEIHFVPDGVIGNNIIINGIVNYFLNKGKKFEELEIIVDSLGCPDSINVCNYLKGKGINVKFIETDEKGNIDLKNLVEILSKKTILIIITSICPTFGSIQDLFEIAKIVKSFNREIIFYVDNQLGYFKNIKEIKKLFENELIDILLVSANKIYGPMISAFYLKKDIPFNNILVGRGLNAYEVGFPNMPYILGFGKAVELKLKNYKDEIKEIKRLQRYLIYKIKNELRDVEILGNELGDKRDPYNLFLNLKDVESEAVFLDLGLKDIIVSTPANCSKNKFINNNNMFNCFNSSIRVTISKFNNENEIDIFVKELKNSYERLKRISSI